MEFYDKRSKAVCGNHLGFKMLNGKIQNLIYLFYEKLPGGMKKISRPGIRAIYSLKEVFSLASQLRLRVFLLQGKGKWGNDSLTILFAGRGTGVGLPYLSDLLYSEEPSKESLGKVFVWKVKSRFNKDFPRVDLIFISADGFLSKFLSFLGFFIIPEWLLFKLDVSRPFPEAWELKKNKSLRENLREMRKHNYSYEITYDTAKFTYFYHQMYLPYITSRFRESTAVVEFRDMERIFRKGELILVKSGDDYVSGNIIRMDENIVLVFALGVAEGMA